MGNPREYHGYPRSNISPVMGNHLKLVRRRLSSSRLLSKVFGILKRTSLLYRRKQLLSQCRYDRVLIRVIVIVAYLGWAAYSSLSILPPVAVAISGNQNSMIRIAASGTLAMFWAFFTAQRSPWTFYVYVIFPCYFWQQFALRGVPILVRQFKFIDRPTTFAGRVLFQLVVVAVVLQCMVVR